MINQCSIEYFATSKKAYQAALLSEELATARILKACDSNQQSSPVWMMAEWLHVKNISGLSTALERWMRSHHDFLFLDFKSFHVIATFQTLESFDDVGLFVIAT